MIIGAAIAIVRMGQSPADEVAYLPGYLEIATGLRTCPDTVMALAFGKSYEADFSGGGVAGGSFAAYNFGFIRFSTSEETLSGQSVWHVHWTGRTISHHGTNRFLLDAATDYWVETSGKILRETASKVSYFGASEATCDYFSDHLELSRKINGKSSSQSIFPAPSMMDQLNDQFKPMLVDGKIVQREKTFALLDLYSGGFAMRSARIGGTFEAKEFDQKFHGHQVVIEFDRYRQSASISDDNDLVRVDLQNGRSIEMMRLPDNREKDSSFVKGHG